MGVSRDDGTAEGASVGYQVTSGAEYPAIQSQAVVDTQRRAVDTQRRAAELVEGGVEWRKVKVEEGTKGDTHCRREIVVPCQTY